MGKLIFWIVAVLVVLTAARIMARIAARNSQGSRPTQARRANRATRNAPAERMVRCAHCGIHVPRSEAIMIGGDTWCSQEHARLGAKH